MRVIFSGYGRAALECLYQLMGKYDIEKSDVIIFTHNTSANNFLDQFGDVGT